jgi:hypothetical protein
MAKREAVVLGMRIFDVLTQRSYFFPRAELAIPHWVVTLNLNFLVGRKTVGWKSFTLLETGPEYLRLGSSSRFSP